MHNHSRYKRSAGPDSRVGVVFRRFRSENLMQISAALAFTTLLSLVPLVTLLLSVAGVVPYLGSLLDSLEGLIRETLLPNGVATAISSNVSRFSHKAQQLTIPGLLLLGFTAVMLMHTIERALNHIWQVKPRPMLARIRFYGLAVLVWPFLLAAIIAAMSFAVTVSLGLLNEPPWLQRAALRGLSLVLLSAFFGFIYYAVPNAKVSIGAASLAGLFAMLGFVVLQKLFELFLVKSAILKSVYGAFATFPVFLIWLHLSWAVILFGGLVAATLSRSKRSG